MSDELINIIYGLLKDNNNMVDLENAKINTYYDIENIKHIKIDLGYEIYILSIDKEND